MAELHTLFPTPVYKNNINYILNDQELDYINSVKDTNIQDNGTLQNGEHYVLDKPVFKGLKQLLQKELDIYAREVFKYSCDLYITHSWLNVNPNGTAHFSHTHVNSVFSGVFYIELPENSSGLTFFNDRKPMFHITPNEFNSFNSEFWTLDMKQGDVVLFPSEMYHEVATNKSTTERISLAFNSFIRGSIGDAGKSNYIELK
jgi:uncharacterized protein (TIGR02466 family)